MPKKRSKKTSPEKEIFIKVKKTSEKSFWDGVNFEDEKSSSDKVSAGKKVIKDKPVEKITEQPEKFKLIKKKKGKKKYILFSILFIILAGLIFVFFFIRPAWSKKYEQKADAESQNKDWTYALEDYQKASTLTPWNSGLYSKIAKIYLGKKQYQDAQKYAQRAIKFAQQNKDANLVLGNVDLLEGNYEQARQNFQKVLDNDNDNVEAYAGLIETAIAQDKKTDAEDLTQKAFLLYPDNPEIIYNQSLVWFLAGNYQKAEEGFDKLNSDNQNSDLADKSNVALETMPKINALPESPYKEVLLGNLYNQIDLPSLAIINFNKALANQATYRDAYLGLGEAYLSENNYQEAENQFKKAQEQDPVNGLTFYLLGETYNYQKMPDKALDFFNKAIERGYDNDKIRKKMTEVYIEKKDFSQALTQYQKALEFNKNDLAVYEKIVWLLSQKLGNPQEAINQAKEAEKIVPQTALTYNILAEAYLANNDLGNAQDAINKAIALDNNFALNYYNLALILQKQKRLEEAKANYIKAADLDNQGNIFNQAYSQLKSL